MLTAYVQTTSGIQSTEITDTNKDMIQNALWIDLLCPTESEKDFAEHYLQLDIPSKQEMVEIEPSSRLYAEEDTLYMTATMVAQSDQPEAKADAVTFILSENRLITIRYIEPLAFNLYISKLKRSKNNEHNAIDMFISLLETTTDRLADILEKVSYKFDEISHMIFHKDENSQTSGEVTYKQILQAIGINGVLGTKTRDSLVSFIRLLSFFEQKYTSKMDDDLKSRLAVVNKDIRALSDYAIFISSEVNFLLDATLGMINIEQNSIIKILSVAAVIFLPPTLIASVYGMNFQHMPELSWFGGYPVSILLMVLSAWIPFRYFRKKKWL